MADRMSERDDEWLLGRIQEGDHEAFAALVHRHTKRYYSLAYQLVQQREDAEDIVQAAFVKLWERPERWDQGHQTRFTTWFYTVVTHLCLDHNKRKKPLPLPEEMELIDQRPTQEERIVHHQRRVVIEGLIRELPERQRLAFTLCFYEGLSNREAAEIIGVTVKAVQSLIMRAKTALKEKLIAVQVRMPYDDGHCTV